MTNRNIVFTAVIVLCSVFSIQAQHKFYLDLNNRETDLFTITLFPDNLSEENNIYQFAATAPGTYSRMDIGRFVKSFKAYDEDGNEIGTFQKSVNQWMITSPEEVEKIIYEIEDTWDAQTDSNFMFRMVGSNIQQDNVLINGQCVFGYFHGMQDEPLNIKIYYPEDWIYGTALQVNSDGYFEAYNFDYIVDSPILLGNLTRESTTISNTDIDVYTYSKTGLIKSADILNSVEDILNAANEFTDGLPVDNYTFLFHFEDVTHGAWEHSYSSFYVYKEASLNSDLVESIREIVAHEFFHIVTPLNIHSEVVEQFNFVEPVMSQHLWFYEGVTEWAANIIELRGSLISIGDYLDILHQKLIHNDNFNQDISLTYLGVNSTKLPDQFFNIYQKGAVVAALLDLRLLELSGGTKGLREVINELSEKYGPDKPFSEKDFFDEFTDMTFPEIKDFFVKYIDGTEPLPIKEYFNKIGIKYSALGDYDSSNVSLGVSIGFNGNNFIISRVDEASPNYNTLKPGDILDMMNGEKLSIQNIQEKINRVKNDKKPGDKISLTVLRDNEPIDLPITLSANREKHIFTINENASPEKINLRNAWLKNL
ncbi:MAG: PDZ domain-containing protein [Ignavibacteriales bacterium]|nr:MAG: PDZ domain-containing protein [Ignavibacteriales bacterium]